MEEKERKLYLSVSVKNKNVESFFNYLEKEMIPKKIKVKEELFNKIENLKPYETKTKEEDMFENFLVMEIEQDNKIKDMFEFIYEEEE